MHYGNDTPSPAWTETGKAPSELALHSQGEKPVLLKGHTSQDHTVINPFISQDSLQRWGNHRASLRPPSQTCPSIVHRQPSPSEVQQESPHLGQVSGLQIVAQLLLADPHVPAVPGLGEVSSQEQCFEEEDFGPQATFCPHCLGELELVVATGCISQEFGFHAVF